MLHARLQLRFALVSLAVLLLAAAARAQVVVPLDSIERETAARVAAGATSVAWICAPAPDGLIGCSAEEDASAARFGDGRPGARLPAGAPAPDAPVPPGARIQPSQQRVIVVELAEIGRGLAADPGSREALARWSALVEGELRAGRDPTRLIPRILEDAQLESMGEDAQLANVDLQNTLQKQQQTLQTLSNISKALHDTAMAVIRKMGG
jgi:hypothetical protein